MIRKHVSVEKPFIDGIEGETVTTKFKNPSGVEKKLVTEGIPGWLKGSDIVNTESEKSTLQGPSIKSGVELTEGAKKIVEGLRSGNKPELNPEGGAISKRSIPVKTKEKSQEVKHVETAKPEENQNDKKNITNKIEKLALDESKDLEKEHIYENIDENGKVKNIESTGPIYENLKFKDHTYENVAFVKSPRYNKHGIIDEENEKQEPIYMNVSFKDHTYENIDDIIRIESGENSRTSSISSSENTESSSSSSSSVSSLVDSGRSNTVVMRKKKPSVSTRYYSDGYLERKYSEIVYGGKKSKKGSISKYMRKLFKKEDKQDNK